MRGLPGVRAAYDSKRYFDEIAGVRVGSLSEDSAWSSPLGTKVVYPSLGIAVTCGTGYPRAWAIPIARISPATPSTLSSTPSSANIWSPSCGKPPTGATATACPASSL